MKMDENKKIFPIFIENKGEHKEILEYTHSPKEQPLSCIMATGATTPVRPQSYIMAPFGRPYKERRFYWNLRFQYLGGLLFH